MVPPATPEDQPTPVVRDGLPFVQVSVTIMRDPSLHPGARLLYAVLATFANLETRECWPTRGLLAGILNCSEDTVDRHAKALVDAGYLEIRRRRSRDDGAVNLPNVWHLLDAHRMWGSRMDAAPPAALVRPPSRAGAAQTKVTEPKSKSTDTRKRALPVYAWSGPDDALYAWAEEQRWTRAAVDGQAQQMRDWALSKDERKVDWNATLRNWLRRQPQPAAVVRQPNGRPVPSSWR